MQRTGESSRLGPTVRAARLRRGWTRETLAHSSGLSFAAITQIETGRRSDIRVSSLVALAKALEVSLDYLVRCDVSPPMLEHRAVAFDSTESLVGLVGPLIRDGLEAEHAVLVVTTKPNVAAIKKEVGGSVNAAFADASEWYSTPAEATTRYAAFAREACSVGATWVDIFGEPVWQRRTPAQSNAWMRYESLLNVIFAPWPTTISCLYDTRTVPTQVSARVDRTHPAIETSAGRRASTSFEPPELFVTA